MISSLAVGSAASPTPAPAAVEAPPAGGGSSPAPATFLGPDGRPAHVAISTPSADPGEDRSGVDAEEALQKDVYAGFTPGVTVLDLAVTPDGLGGQLALALQSDGVLRVLSLAGETPRELVSYPLSTRRPLRELGRLTPGEAGRFLVPEATGVALFAPTSARSAEDVTWVDLAGSSVTWPRGTPDSAGFEAGGSPLPIGGTSAALELGGRLFVTSTNPAGERGHWPGTLSVIDLEGRAAPRIVATGGFVPSGLSLLRSAAGTRLLVTNSGAPGSPSSVDVVDPGSLERLSSVSLPAGAWGPVLVTPDGTRGFLACEREARVLVLDLSGAAPSYLGRLELPSAADRNQISQLLLDPFGRLVVVNHFESALYLLSFAGTGASLQRMSGFSRSGDPSRLEGLLERVALRSAAEGVELLALTVELAPGDQSVPGVSAALDVVRLP